MQSQSLACLKKTATRLKGYKTSKTKAYLEELKSIVDNRNLDGKFAQAKETPLGREVETATLKTTYCDSSEGTLASNAYEGPGKRIKCARVL